MKITPISKYKFNQNFKATTPLNTLELLHRNYSVEIKPLAEKIMAACQPVSTSGSASVYRILPPDSMRQKKPVGGVIKDAMEIVIDRSKKLISSIKIFSGSNPNTCIENSQYTYNKKGQIIRVAKQTTSPNGITNEIKTNIKYDGDTIIIKKDMNSGAKISQTIITNQDGKKLILKSGQNNENKSSDSFKYKEGEILQSTIESGYSSGRFEANGDPFTGEMVFSKNTLNPVNAGEYIELLDNGMYYKQIMQRNGSVTTREIPQTVADDFIHRRIDLLTPQNEILTKLEEYGI